MGPDGLKTERVRLVEILRDDIDTRRVFITDSGLPDDVRARLREVVLSCQPFEEVYNNRAGCTISGHCGPWCMGVLYYHK